MTWHGVLLFLSGSTPVSLGQCYWALGITGIIGIVPWFYFAWVERYGKDEGGAPSKRPKNWGSHSSKEVKR